MEKGDIDYKIMEYLDVRVGHNLLALVTNADMLEDINVNNNAPYKDIIRHTTEFRQGYDKLKETYSKFGVLSDDIETRHGRAIIEQFKTLLPKIESPLSALECMVNSNCPVQKIKEQVDILYNLSVNLSDLSCQFAQLKLFSEYTALKYLH